MYILDTNICIYIINNQPKSVRAKFQMIDLRDISISSITLFELDAGARKSQKIDNNLKLLNQFVEFIQVLPFDAAAARSAGGLRQELRAKGTPIGDMDTLIAAHALSLNATIVSNNIKEFERIPELNVENWL